MPAADDSVLIPLFKHHATLNEAKTAKEGREIYDDIEVVDIRAPGSRNFVAHAKAPLTTR